MFGAEANSADPDQTPQNAASDQGLQCLLTLDFYKKEKAKNEKSRPAHIALLRERRLLHLIRMETFTGQIWVKWCFGSHSASPVVFV